MQADLVVKSVMIGLIFASVVTWTVWLAKSIELAAARRRVRSALHKLNAANSVGEAVNLVDAKRGAVPAMLRAAVAETRASWDVADKYAIKERVSARLDRIELAAGRDINRGTGVLATIGSTAPFVGLFGTVWGIMNSFIGISEAQTTNLADRRSRHRRSFARHRLRPRRRHPGGHDLQSLRPRHRRLQGARRRRFRRRAVPRVARLRSRCAS